MRNRRIWTAKGSNSASGTNADFPLPLLRRVRGTRLLLASHACLHYEDAASINYRFIIVVKDKIGMDVQAVLQDIYNDGENEFEQRSLSYPESLPPSYHARAERLFSPRQTPALTYHQNAIIDLHNTRPQAPVSAHFRVSDDESCHYVYGNCGRA